jgi:hypothetical protein
MDYMMGVEAEERCMNSDLLSFLRFQNTPDLRETHTFMLVA